MTAQEDPFTNTLNLHLYIEQFPLKNWEHEKQMIGSPVDLTLQSGHGDRSCPSLLPQWTSANLLSPCPNTFSCRPSPPPPHALIKSPSKAAPQAWQGASIPKRGQHHPKVTPAPWRGQKTHTYWFSCSSSSGLVADICFGCMPHPPMKASQGTTQGEHPTFVATAALANICSDLTQAQSSPKLVSNNTGTKPYPQQPKRATEDNYTEGKCGWATTVGWVERI